MFSLCGSCTRSGHLLVCRKPRQGLLSHTSQKQTLQTTMGRERLWHNKHFPWVSSRKSPFQWRNTHERPHQYCLNWPPDKQTWSHHIDVYVHQLAKKLIAKKGSKRILKRIEEVMWRKYTWCVDVKPLCRWQPCRVFKRAMSPWSKWRRPPAKEKLPPVPKLVRERRIIC